MNRQQRRQAEKRGITSKDLKQVEKDTIGFVAKMYAVASAMVLHDKLGFGKIKVQRTMKQIQELFEGIDEGYVSLEDLERVLKEECDIVFK